MKLLKGLKRLRKKPTLKLKRPGLPKPLTKSNKSNVNKAINQKIRRKGRPDPLDDSEGSHDVGGVVPQGHDVGGVVSFDDDEIMVEKSHKDIFCGETFDDLAKKLKVIDHSRIDEGCQLRCSGCLHPWLLAQLKAEGYIEMTRIQSESIPRALKGHDVLIRCQTGSGKTLSFMIPAIQYLLELEPPNLTRSEPGTTAGVDFPVDQSEADDAVEEFKNTSRQRLPLDRSFGTRVGHSLVVCLTL